MRTITRTLIGATAGLALATTMGAGLASAAPAVTVYNVPCWTSFNPTNPHGAAMTQYYANCDSGPVTVCPAVTVNDKFTIFTTLRRPIGKYDLEADSTDTAVWPYSDTIPNGLYTTVFC